MKRSVRAMMILAAVAARISLSPGITTAYLAPGVELGQPPLAPAASQTWEPAPATHWPVSLKAPEGMQGDGQKAGRQATQQEEAPNRLRVILVTLGIMVGAAGLMSLFYLFRRLRGLIPPPPQSGEHHSGEH